MVVKHSNILIFIHFPRFQRVALHRTEADSLQPAALNNNRKVMLFNKIMGENNSEQFLFLISYSSTILIQ